MKFVTAQKIFIFMMIILTFANCKTTQVNKPSARLTSTPLNPMDAICSFPEHALLEASMESESRLNNSNAVSARSLHDNQVSWPSLLTSAVASKLAYKSQSEIVKQLNRYGYPLVEHISEGPIYGFIAINRDKGCMIVAFRGSDDIRDWFSNIKIKQTRIQKGLVHSGFLSTYQSINSRIQNVLKSYNSTVKHIIVTGHSLGGALACLLAYEQSNKNAQNPRSLKISHLITFGQPMFADSKLAKYMYAIYGAKYLRVVHGRDIVTRIPKDYYHTGDLLWLHEGTSDFRSLAAASNTVSPASIGTVPESGSYVDPTVAPNTPGALYHDQNEFEDFMRLEIVPLDGAAQQNRHQSSSNNSGLGSFSSMSSNQVLETNPSTQSNPELGGFKSLSSAGSKNGTSPSDAPSTPGTRPESSPQASPQSESAVGSFFVPVAAEDHRMIYYIESVQSLASKL